VLRVVLLTVVTPDVVRLLVEVFPALKDPESVVFPAESVPRVVFPAERGPVTVFPEVICPATPSPPEIVMAPDDVLVLAVVFVILALLAVKLVSVVFPDESVPDVICPATPRPPDTVKAPVPVVVLAVALVMLVLPLAVRLPEIVVFPALSVPVVLTFPAVTCPDIPAPPETINAPDVVEILADVLFTEVTPLEVRVPEILALPEARVPAVEKLPAFTCPDAPIPPTTTSAPVEVLEDKVPLVSVVFPLALSVPEIVVLLEARVPVIVFPEVT